MTTVNLTSSQRTAASSRLFRAARRVILIVTLLFATIGAWSAYRAWFQVRSLEVRVMSPDVQPGLPVVVQVVTSGSMPVDVRLELAQGTHAEVLATLRVAAGHGGFFDTREPSGVMTPAFTAGFLAQFLPGPALLRATATATATGRPRWFPTPPATVKEVAVIVPPSAPR